MKKQVPIDFAGARLNEQLARTGLRLTAQRRQVYNVLLLKRDHPSAEEVFLRAKSAMPDISMATVYNCLDTLVKCGLVKQVNHDRGATRYCSNMQRHHHFYCDDCGGTFDIEPGPAGGAAPNGPARGLPRARLRDFAFTAFARSAPPKRDPRRL